MDGAKRNSVGAFRQLYDTLYKKETNPFGSASFIKLKELNIAYNFPKKLLERTKIIQGLTVSAYATNLFCLSNYPFYDPEVTGYVGSNTKRGIESGSLPMTRSFGANIKIRF